MNNNRMIKSSLFFIIITIYTLLFIYNIYLLNNIRFNWIIVDDNKYNSIMETRSEYQDDMISKIEFNGNELFDVSDTNEFFYSMVVKDFNKYNPYIKYKSDLDNTEIVLLENRITDELISKNEHIKLLIYNDDYYKEYEIVVTTLPIMNISYKDNEENNRKVNFGYKEIQTENIDSDIYGGLYIFDNESSIVTNTNLKFHVRGATSATFPKKGFKLSLKDNNGESLNRNLLNMRNDDDWILYAGYNDQERVRNVFSSRIWYDCCASDNQFGIKAGMYYKYVELFMNGKYHGLYALGFQVDDKQLNIKAGEYIYKKSGYYLENNVYDITDDSIVPTYENKSANNSAESNRPLKEYFNCINSLEYDQILKKHDLNNIFDIYIFNQLIQNVDGGKQIYIVYKDDIYLYIPWDLDQSFGNVWKDYVKNNIGNYAVDQGDNELGNWYILFLNIKDNVLFKESLKKRYFELKNNGLTYQNFERIINQYEKAIFGSGAYKRDVITWPSSSSGMSDLNIFKEYVEARFVSIDNYYNML